MSKPFLVPIKELSVAILESPTDTRNAESMFYDLVFMYKLQGSVQKLKCTTIEKSVACPTEGSITDILAPHDAKQVADKIERASDIITKTRI
ncbi:hypothetical protein BGX31_000824 [Mortierella sp. GBA43]|nr:hypothetical protein BGX31_000824 [Mortierella sp. GBA43]